MSRDCQYSIKLINRLRALDTDRLINFGQVNKAINWAIKYHGEQKRKSGEPYYTHPLEVAHIVSKCNPKTNVIVAAILHDIVEDTEVTFCMVFHSFGQRIADMVNRLTRYRPDGTKWSVEQMLDNAYAYQDHEVLLIKVADRLHNMQTLGAMSEAKQNRIAMETLQEITACATNIEIHKELVLLAAKIIKPDLCSTFDKIYSKIPSYRSFRLPFLR